MARPPLIEPNQPKSAEQPSPALRDHALERDVEADGDVGHQVVVGLATARGCERLGSEHGVAGWLVDGAALRQAERRVLAGHARVSWVFRLRTQGVRVDGELALVE